VDRLGRHRRGEARRQPGRSARIDAAIPCWDLPIPAVELSDDWLRRPIAECGEPLVALSAYAPDRIAVEPRYHRAGYAGALPECYVRIGAARRLADAATLLPAGWRFVVYDGWRPVAVQQAIYAGYQALLRQQHPNWTAAVLDQETRRYVALPSTDPARPSPHLTGGTVDLSLLDAAGRPVELGTAFDAFDPASRTTHYERQLAEQGTLPPRDQAALHHRRLLYHALAQAGFINYPEEWWHYEHGRSRYGPVLTLEGCLA
jgi:D-alanyl-D-alanine dipeptidase